ncbi:MAG: hypothetical protein CSA20_08515 [Deltaproteobacteria bacterium]|nr:MAG: hypothetical protein CSA20_08515 [Deltaproteobacteria bacterium]
MALSTEAKLYRWDDDNAPVLSGTRGSLCALLKACLVDGYGSKVAAGWSVPYSSADDLIKVYQGSSDSNGFVLRVDEQTSADARYPTLQGFEAMTDIDNGLQGFPSSPLTSAADTWGHMFISDAASTASRAWALIANEACFYLFIFTGTDDPTADDRVKSLFFGDIIAFNQNDSYNTVLSLCGGGNRSYYNQKKWDMGGFVAHCPGDDNEEGVYVREIADATQPLISSPRGASGDALAGPVEQMVMITGGGPRGCEGAYGRLCRGYHNGEVLHLGRPMVPDYNFNIARGWLPGLYVPSAYFSYPPCVVFSYDDQEYFYVCGYPQGGTDTGQKHKTYMLINLTHFWA